MRARLAEALRRAGLTPPAARVPYLRALVRHRGEYERSLLIAEMGEPLWRVGLRSLSTVDPGNAVVYALGHGSLLAEFAMAPVRSSQADIDRVATLGARANLIVTAYDNLLDQGRAPQDILQDDFTPASKAPWLGILVHSYFRLLGQHRTSVLDHAIRRMYVAEKSTGPCNLILWRRKNALPFVVLGLGGCHFAHRAWLYRAGLLMGWIDDAVDAGRDARLGRWNRFDGEAGTLRIARLGQRVMQWWDQHVNRRECRQAFLYCLNTWTVPRTR